jgi:hypothetical protein
MITTPKWAWWHVLCDSTMCCFVWNARMSTTTPNGQEKIVVWVTGNELLSIDTRCLATRQFVLVKNTRSRFAEVSTRLRWLTEWRLLLVHMLTINSFEGHELFAALWLNRLKLNGRCKVPQCFHHTVFGEHSKTGKTRFSVCPCRYLSSQTMNAKSWKKS